MAMKEDTMDILKIYTVILDNCRSKIVSNYLITRIYKILSKEFKKREATDFPQIPYDLQVVHLVSYLKEDKLAYAFLYSSSLSYIIEQNRPKIVYKRPEGTRGIWEWFRGLFW